MRALLIEDNDDDVLLVQKALAGTGKSDFAMEAASTLAGGLAILARQPTDLALLDLSLPDSKGLDTLAKLVAAQPTLPIVVLTGLHDDTLGVEAIRTGAQDYLVKGEFNGVLLMRVMQYALERKKTEQQLRELNAQLQEANGKLARMNSFMMDREERILELKQQVQELCRQRDPGQEKA